RRPRPAVLGLPDGGRSRRVLAIHIHARGPDSRPGDAAAAWGRLGDGLEGFAISRGQDFYLFDASTTHQPADDDHLSVRGLPECHREAFQVHRLEPKGLSRRDEGNGGGGHRRRDERRRGGAVGRRGRIGLGEGDDGYGSHGESEEPYGQPVPALVGCLLDGAVGRDLVVRHWHQSVSGGMPTRTDVTLGSSARRRIRSSPTTSRTSASALTSGEMSWTVQSWPSREKNRTWTYWCTTVRTAEVAAGSG